MRDLSQKFLTDLKKGGMLYPILKAVQENKDFILCFRNEKIDIYYKGGRIFSLELKNKKYEVCKFDINYAMENKAKISKINKFFEENIIAVKNDAKKWVKKIYYFKDLMDFYFCNSKKENMEKYIQQLIVQENNLFKASNDTDFFIIDFEYQTEGNDSSRFDLIGLFWDRNTRKKPKNCKLVIIEVKHGYENLTGNSGLLEHLKKADAFLSGKGQKESLKKEMLNLFKQERELKLLNINAKQEVTEIDPEIDFIFILAGYNPGNETLSQELEKMDKEIGNFKTLKKTNIKFAIPSFAGYSIFKENIKSFQEFQDILKNEKVK